LIEKLLSVNAAAPLVPLISNPNWHSPIVTLPHQPWVRSQFAIAPR